MSFKEILELLFGIVVTVAFISVGGIFFWAGVITLIIIIIKIIAEIFY